MGKKIPNQNRRNAWMKPTNWLEEVLAATNTILAMDFMAQRRFLKEKESFEEIPEKDEEC